MGNIIDVIICYNNTRLIIWLFNDGFVNIFIVWTDRKLKEKIISRKF